MKGVVNWVWKGLVAEFEIWRVGILPGGLVIALIVATRLLGGLQLLEWLALDHLLRSRPPEPMDQRIVIVGIDEDDIRSVGDYPIPDREIAALLNQLVQVQPAVIGLDIFRDLPVEPGHSELVQVFQNTDHLIGINKVLPDRSGKAVHPPPALPPEQVGFVDVIPDADGAMRRSLLGTPDLQGNYQFSWTIRLAEQYLSTQGVAFGNGTRDPEAMRFGSVELTRFRPHTGGYIRADAGGNQILLNYRSGPSPFRIISMQDVLLERVNPDILRGRIVLVGVMAPSIKDTVKSMASHSNSALIYGVEAQAHAVSQIVSAVLDQRPLLSVWTEGWEYLWIVGWGVMGVGLGRWLKTPLKIILSVAIASTLLVSMSYGAILTGLWIPVVPAFLVLLLNGGGFAAASFYQQEQELRSRLQQRQLMIDQTFNAIHNGPLQTLAKLLRQEGNPDFDASQMFTELRLLNQELRSVQDRMQREMLQETDQFSLMLGHELDLHAPLHQVLEEVYHNVLLRDYPCFKTLRIRIPDFHPVDERHLSPEQKRGLCRFLEEALCNVGKHAVGAKRLEVRVRQVEGRNEICVVDDGPGCATLETEPKSAGGLGTRQAKRLARQLQGEFERSPHSPQGTVCRLSWVSLRQRFGRFGRF